MRPSANGNPTTLTSQSDTHIVIASPAAVCPLASYAIANILLTCLISTGSRESILSHRRRLMPSLEDEDPRLHSAALQNAHASLLASERAHDELLCAQEALQARERQLSLIYRNVSDVLF